MKINIRIILFLAVALLAFVACNSKEKKAETLIRDWAYKSLYDYDSYQVIETKIDSAYFTPYTDSVIMKGAILMTSVFREYSSNEKKAKEAINEIKAGGNGAILYRMYKEDAEEALKEMQKYRLWGVQLMKIIKDDTANLPKGFQGWAVNQTFRCKTKQGESTISQYLFITDKKFKSILYQEDIEDNEIKAAKKTLKDILEIPDLQIEEAFKKAQEDLDKQ